MSGCNQICVAFIVRWLAYVISLSILLCKVSTWKSLKIKNDCFHLNFLTQIIIFCSDVFFQIVQINAGIDWAFVFAPLWALEGVVSVHSIWTIFEHYVKWAKSNAGSPFMGFRARIFQFTHSIWKVIRGQDKNPEIGPLKVRLTW